MDKRKIIKLSFLLFILYGCWNPKNNEQRNESFYDNRSGWDYIRLPLIKPYEAINFNSRNSGEWNITFHNELKNNAATNVKEISLSDSLIFIYCGDSTLFNYQYVKSAWYVIDTKKKAEKGFLKEGEFLLYILNNNYTSAKWHNIDSLSKAYGDGKILP